MDTPWVLHGKYSHARAAERLGSVECRTVDIQDCRPKLPHDKRLSLLKSRHGGSAGAKRARGGLRGSMERDPKKGATFEPTSPPLD